MLRFLNSFTFNKEINFNEKVASSPSAREKWATGEGELSYVFNL